MKESLQLLTNHTKSSNTSQPESTWLDISKTLISAGKVKRAQKVLLKLSESPEVLHYLAICVWKLDAANENFRNSEESSNGPVSQKAEQLFNKVLTINPKAELSYRELTRYFIKSGRTTDAIHTLRSGYENCPESLEIGTSYGLILCESGNFELAEQILTPMVDMDPENLRATLAAGVCSQLNFKKSKKRGSGELLQVKDLNKQQFFKFYKQIYKYAPESPALWNNIGLAVMNADAWASLFCLKRANYLSPLDTSILFNLGLVCYNLKQYIFATSTFQTARNIQEISKTPKSSPMSLQTNMMLAMSLWRVGDIKNARRAFQEGVQNMMKSGRAKDPWIYTNFALFEFFQGEKPDTAWKIVSHWLNEEPGKVNGEVSMETLKQMVSALK